MNRILAQISWTPCQSGFDAFAALSGDDNPIHTNPDYAAQHPFGAPVAHGMLIWARLQSLAQAAGISLTADVTLRFPAPAYAGERLDLRVTEEEGTLSARAARADGTLVCEILWGGP